MIDSTLDVEKVTWYRDQSKSPVRVEVTVPNSRREMKMSAFEKAIFGSDFEGKLEPAKIEVFPISGEASAFGMETPEELMELAEALRDASLLWSHCIGECDCREESNAETEGSHDKMPFEVVEIPGGIAINLGSFSLSDIFAGATAGGSEEDRTPEDAPSED